MTQHEGEGVVQPLGPAVPSFKALFEASPGLYLALAPDLTIVAVSEAYLRATMTQREKILGKGIFEVFPDNPNDPEATGVSNLRASLEQVIAHKRADAMAVQKYDIARPAGEGGGFEERYWSPYNSPVLDASGELEYIIHTVVDVTEFIHLRRQGAEQLKLAEELRLRGGAMETEIFRRAQEIQAANRQLRELHSELELRVQARTGELLRANEELQRQIEGRHQTEQALRRSEEQLRQSQKLDAVGRLAGGIAHDFNNLLTVVLSYCGLLLAELAPNEPNRAELEQIKLAGERAAELTRQLLVFSRHQMLDPKIVDLNEILTNLNKMLGRVLGEDIELKLQLPTRLGKVKADPSQIEQVIMNLVVNARDAMPKGGKLTIETSEIELTEPYAADHFGVEPGSYVLLAVSDTGVGMDKTIQQRVFDPFFTTKDPGKGTGLGLSTVFGIVKQSGGSIWLYSEPGAGTTFKLYFPRTEETARLPPSVPPGRTLRGNETILLVEDDNLVRNVACDMLRKFGYHVLEARSPGEALLICEQHPVSIDLLLTDVVMPKMNGRQLAERLGAMRPRMKVIFMSGYTDDAMLHHGLLEAGIHLLQKPLTPNTVTRKVREVLDG